MKPYAAAVVFLWVLMITAHVVAPASYDWTQNTVSQLAAQGYSNRWVMQVGLAGFGLLLLCGALGRIAREPGRKWTDGPLAIAGGAFLLSALFCTRPFLPGEPYSEPEAVVHGTVSTLARIAASVSMLLSAIRERSGLRKRVHVATFCIFVVVSALVEVLTAGLGIAQRVLFLLGCAWLVFTEAVTDLAGNRDDLAAST